jgi:hypothetical protein
MKRDESRRAVGWLAWLVATVEWLPSHGSTSALDLGPERLGSFREDLLRFLRQFGPALPGVPAPSIHLSDAATRKSLLFLRPLYEWAVKRQGAPLIGYSVTGYLTITTDRAKRPVVAIKYIEPVQIVEAMARLIAAHWGRIRPCARASCGRVFVAVRRQRYCSNRCGNATRVGRFRESLRIDNGKKRRRGQQQKGSRLRRSRARRAGPLAPA